MKLTKHILFISMFSAISGAQAASVGLLGGSLNDQTVFAHTYVTSGSGVGTVGNGWTVNGNVLSNAATTIGAHSYVSGSTQSSALTIGASGYINNNATSSTATTTGAMSTINGNLVSGTAVTLGASSNVIGTVDYGTALTAPASTSTGGSTQNSAPVVILDEHLGVSSAQNTLNGMTGTDTINVEDIATDQTFTSGVYNRTGLLTTTAGVKLTLDAQNLDGDFIFNISGYLSFGADTVVEVINGTGNNNVIWNTGSYAATGAKSDIVGTILAHTYVTVGANALVSGTYGGCGGVFAATGYVTLGANATVGGNGCSGAISTPSAVPLPAAVWLFGSGLIGLAGIARRKKA